MSVNPLPNESETDMPGLTRHGHHLRDSPDRGLGIVVEVVLMCWFKSMTSPVSIPTRLFSLFQGFLL